MKRLFALVTVSIVLLVSVGAYLYVAHVEEAAAAASTNFCLQHHCGSAILR